MLWLVLDINLVDIDSLDWEKLQRNAPCHILRMCVSWASIMFSFGSWVIYIRIGCRHPFVRYWQLSLGKTTATCSLLHPENERQQCVNDFHPRIMGNLCSDWLQRSIYQRMAAFTGENYSGMLPAASWRWVSTERQRFIAWHPGELMFRFVVDIQSSNIGCLYWKEPKWHAPCRILRMSVNAGSMIVNFESWVI